MLAEDKQTFLESLWLNTGNEGISEGDLWTNPSTTRFHLGRHWNRPMFLCCKGIVIILQVPISHWNSSAVPQTKRLLSLVFIMSTSLCCFYLMIILSLKHLSPSPISPLLSPLSAQLGTVSLALFRTLIGLYCEDVMLQLILRYGKHARTHTRTRMHAHRHRQLAHI